MRVILQAQLTAARAACLAAFVSVGLMAPGCGSAGELGSQVGPSPVVLADTAPAQLSVTIDVNMGGYDVTSRPHAVLDVALQHGGHPVRFVGGETVGCAGVSMTRYIGSFEASLTIASIAGKEVACTYSWHGRSASLTLHVPQALVILAPADDARLDHNSRTLVRFSGVTSTDLWVVGLSATAKAVAGPGDITTKQALLDTKALGIGAGSIALTDPNNFDFDADGPAFASVSGSARRMTMVTVVWT